MIRRLIALTLAGVVAGGLSFGTAGARATKMPPLYRKCANFNVKYPHGVGRAGARDRVKGDTEPVTTFKRSTTIYRVAMSWNRRLDADEDGVACEKA